MEKDRVMTVKEGCRVDVIGYQNFFPQEFFIHSVWILSYFLRPHFDFWSDKHWKEFKSTERYTKMHWKTYWKWTKSTNFQTRVLFSCCQYSIFLFCDNKRKYQRIHWPWIQLDMEGESPSFFLITIKIHADIRFEVVKSLSA